MSAEKDWSYVPLFNRSLKTVDSYLYISISYGYCFFYRIYYCLYFCIGVPWTTRNAYGMPYIKIGVRETATNMVKDRCFCKVVCVVHLCLHPFLLHPIP